MKQDSSGWPHRGGDICAKMREAGQTDIWVKSSRPEQGSQGRWSWDGMSKGEVIGVGSEGPPESSGCTVWDFGFFPERRATGGFRRAPKV